MYDYCVDAIDLRILEILQDEGRLAVSELAERVGLSEAPTWRRLKRLEESGIILGYRAELDRRALGLSVFAIVSVRFSVHDLPTLDAFAAAVEGMACVQSCHNVTGEVDYILTVVAKDLDEYEAFTRSLRGIPGVTSIQTHLSLREMKATTRIELR